MPVSNQEAIFQNATAGGGWYSTREEPHSQHQQHLPCFPPLCPLSLLLKSSRPLSLPIQPPNRLLRQLTPKARHFHLPTQFLPLAQPPPLFLLPLLNHPPQLLRFLLQFGKPRSVDHSVCFLASRDDLGEVGDGWMDGRLAGTGGDGGRGEGGFCGAA